MDIRTAIKERKSVRKFLDKPVDKRTIEELLEVAKWAPSGANCQPWRVDVVMGKKKDEITRAILEAKEKGITEEPEMDYYPETWKNPYKERRFKCGLALYSAIGIKRGDVEARKEAWFRNYKFFDAPVGLFFSMPKCLGTGYLVDMGIFIQTVALAALDFGLSTCIQASLAEYPNTVKRILDIPDTFSLICGMSLGYEDKNAPINSFRTQRVSIEDFVNWHQ